MLGDMQKAQAEVPRKGHGRAEGAQTADRSGKKKGCPPTGNFSRRIDWPGISAIASCEASMRILRMH